MQFVSTSGEREEVVAPDLVGLADCLGHGLLLFHFSQAFKGCSSRCVYLLLYMLCQYTTIKMAFTLHTLHNVSLRYILIGTLLLQ